MKIVGKIWIRLKQTKYLKQIKQTNKKEFTTDISGNKISWQQFYDQSTFYLKGTKNPTWATQQF